MYIIRIENLKYKPLHIFLKKLYNAIISNMDKRILIIDDDLYIRELYAEVLADAGYIVDTAKDGLEGLNKIKKGGYVAVLLDVMMPQMDGIQVLIESAKQKPEKPNGPTILLTNLSHDPIIQEGLKQGAKTYLIKADITPDELVEKLEDLLN